MSTLNEVHVLPVLEKAPTGIRGLDEMTRGGLPRGRPTLVCGDSGSGRRLLAMDFLVRSGTQFDEPGVFGAFEENLNDLAQNFGSLGFDINGLIAQKSLAVVYIPIEPSEIEEYDSDRVVVPDHRIAGQAAARRMRIAKYRGSAHGTREFPFLITEHGLSVLPITSIGLTQQVSSERVPTGIPRLDAMLGGVGYYRGSSILMSGSTGSGKSSIAASFVDIYQQPELAESLQIVAAPTLLKKLPLPLRTLVGNLSEVDRILLALGLPREQQVGRKT